MRINFLLFILVWLLSFSGQTVFATDFFAVNNGEIDVSFGYRADQLDWNIASGLAGETPNILSELTWDNIKLVQLQLSGRLELGELPFLNTNTLLLVNADLGKIFAGDYQDSDYGTDNRGNEWSRSIGDGDKGFTADLSGGLGPIFKIDRVAGLSVSPLIGYGFNMQDLSMTSGVQIISKSGLKPAGLINDPPANGNISGLDSSYTAYWYGPWLGFKIDYQVSKKFNLSTEIEYHWIEYFAQADWNLRTDLKHNSSFEHETTGTGTVWNIKGRYVINEKWSWLISGILQDWETENGTVRTFKTDGSVSRTRLNEVNWNSLSLSMGVSYEF